MLLLLERPLDVRHRVSPLLRHYPQALRIPHHVSAHSACDKVHFLHACAAIGELHFRISRSVAVHQPPVIRKGHKLLQTAVHHRHHSSCRLHALRRRLPPLWDDQLLPPSRPWAATGGAPSFVSDDAVLGRPPRSRRGRACRRVQGRERAIHADDCACRGRAYGDRFRRHDCADARGPRDPDGRRGRGGEQQRRRGGSPKPVFPAIGALQLALRRGGRVLLAPADTPITHWRRGWCWRWCWCGPDLQRAAELQPPCAEQLQPRRRQHRLLRGLVGVVRLGRRRGPSARAHRRHQWRGLAR